MNRSPITRQRSPWAEHTPSGALLARVPGVLAFRIFRRRVGDGHLHAIVAIEDPIGWHLSISHRDQRGELTRYPTWDEIAHARDELLPPDLAFVMHLPTSDEYVALHDTTFHLHQHPSPEGKR